MSQKHDAYRVYLIYNFTWSLGLTLVFTVNMVYLVLVLRLDPLQMVLVGTALELSALLFEVPTGVLADHYSRRLSVIIGTALMGISFFVFVTPLFAMVLFSQVIMGLGWAFISGANSAWLADEIGEENAGTAYLRGSQAGQVAGMIGLILSVGFAMIDLRLSILLAGVVLILLSLYLRLFMPETGFTPAPYQNRETFRIMAKTTQKGLYTIRGKPVLITLMGAIFVWGAFSEVYDRLSTLHILENFNLPQVGELDVVIWFGVIGLGSLPLGLVATEFVRRRVAVEDPVAIARTLIRASAVLLLALPVFALTQQFWVLLLAIWVIAAMRTITTPLREAWLNQGLPSEVRATVLSMAGQMDAFGQIAGGPAIGLLAQRSGVRIALAAGAVILLPIIGLYARTIRQHGRLADSGVSAQYTDLG